MFSPSEKSISFRRIPRDQHVILCDGRRFSHVPDKHETISFNASFTLEHRWMWENAFSSPSSESFLICTFLLCCLFFGGRGFSALLFSYFLFFFHSFLFFTFTFFLLYSFYSSLYFFFSLTCLSRFLSTLSFSPRFFFLFFHRSVYCISKKNFVYLLGSKSENTQCFRSLW